MHQEQQQGTALQEYAKDARALGRRNIGRVLVWLYRWGWTTEPVLQRMLGVQRHVGAEMARRGYLLRVDPPRGHRPAYVIAPAYQRLALELYEDDPGSVDIPYPYPRNRVGFGTAEHDELAQLIALEQIRPGDILSSARELRGGKAVPDFVIERGDSGLIEWHEVELSKRYDEKLFHQLKNRNDAMKHGDFNRIVWHCGTAGVGRNIEFALLRPAIPMTHKRADYKLVKTPGVAGWNPTALREATTIHVAKVIR